MSHAQEVVSPDMMIPEARLQSLVEQALDRQLERCLFHNVRKPMVSLLCDYQCGREQIPSVVCQVRICSQVYKLKLSCQQHRMQSLCIAVNKSTAHVHDRYAQSSCKLAQGFLNDQSVLGECIVMRHACCPSHSADNGQHYSEMPGNAGSCAFLCMPG